MVNCIVSYPRVFTALFIDCGFAPNRNWLTEFLSLVVIGCSGPYVLQLLLL